MDFLAKVKYAVEKKVSLHLMPHNLDFQCKWSLSDEIVIEIDWK